jgi:hypothetical protein
MIIDQQNADCHNGVFHSAATRGLSDRIPTSITFRACYRALLHSSHIREKVFKSTAQK